MSNSKANSLNFSQREGLSPIPPQLKLKQLSKELRALIWATLNKHMQDTKRKSNLSPVVYLGQDWDKILRDINVEVGHGKAHEFKNYLDDHQESISNFIFSVPYNAVFDFIEYVLKHSACPPSLANDLQTQLVKGRAAYRIVDRTIIAPVGSEIEANCIGAGILDADEAGLSGAKAHLVSAVEDARRGDWAGSIRESISAVESAVILLAPESNSLGAAIKILESGGHLHGALKSAFSQLYGFTSDEDGIRHALVLRDKAQVDEADALFMLGACASFVSYLISKGRSLGVITN